MKAAICYSGIPRGDWNKNRNSVSKHFNFDTFYFTWNDHVGSMPKDVSFLYDKEPEVDYHCLIDVPKHILTHKLEENRKLCLIDTSFRERIRHHTKQILAHSMLLKTVPSDYDMIIRCRYDTYLSPQVDFTKYLEYSYNNNCAIGFGTRTSRHNTIHRFREVPKIQPRPNLDDSQDWYKYLMDPLIIHPRKLFSCDLVEEYNKERKLLPAENGWYQILSEPYGDNHICVYGGAQIEKYL